MTPDERIFSAASRFIGVTEIPGPGSNPTIVKFIDEAAKWLKDGISDIDGAIPWCGCFRGHIGLSTATGIPPEHFRASAWAKWGRPVKLDPSTWKRGMTVIMSRSGGNHVTLFSHFQDGLAFCLGGNQSDKVCIAPFQVSRITTVRTAPEHV